MLVVGAFKTDLRIYKMFNKTFKLYPYHPYKRVLSNIETSYDKSNMIIGKWDWYLESIIPPFPARIDNGVYWFDCKIRTFDIYLIFNSHYILYESAVNDGKIG